MKPKKLKVRIIGAQASMWYNGNIGDVFKVTDTGKPLYYNHINNRIIFKCDVIKIS